MATETQSDAVTAEDKGQETEPATGQDVAEGGILGAVGGAIVGGLAGGPIGAVIGAVLGGVASAGAVDLIDKHDHDAALPETVLPETALLTDPSPGAAIYAGVPDAPAYYLDTPAPMPDRSVLIRERAYALYEQRGRVDGRDVEDWLEAEREIFP